MKIALTGSTGFVGSHFLKQALDSGNSVLAIRRSNTSMPRIPLSETPTWLTRSLDKIKANDLEGCDVLVHMAAHTANIPYDNLANCIYWNLVSVIALLEEARLANIRRFIIAGTCFEYGHSGEKYIEIPANASLEPTNSYAASKAAASIAFCQWASEYNVSLEILRIFHVYGEGEPEKRFWPSLRRAALAGDDFPMTKGEQVRDFQPVEAVAEAFLQRASLDLFDIGGKIYNLGTGNPQTILHFAESCWNDLKPTGKLQPGLISYRPNEVMRYAPKTDILI